MEKKCTGCYENHNEDGTLCVNCQLDSKNMYSMGYLKGRNRSGSEPTGTKIHALPMFTGFEFGSALCGAKPGKRSNGFGRPYDYLGAKVTCPRCLKKINRVSNEDKTKMILGIN